MVVINSEKTKRVIAAKKLRTYTEVPLSPPSPGGYGG